MLKTRLFILSILLLINLQAWSQKWITVNKEIDSLYFSPTQILLTRDTVFISSTDSFVVFKKGEKYRIRSNPFSKSESFYDSLQVKAYRNKITRELYYLLVRSTPIEVQDTSNFNKSESVYLNYRGMKIRSIRIKKLDVLEGSVHDTLVVAQSFTGKSANKIHMNTREYVIYNYLTIKEGDIIDPVKIADNERILRSNPYIEDARILIEKMYPDKNEVDLLVLTKDKFSYGIGFDYKSIQDFKIHVYNKNFLGTGHEMRNYLIYKTSIDPEYGYAFRYKVNNISNSFTTLRLDYENSWDRKYAGFNISKEFLTQQTKYAGGLTLYQIADTRDYIVEDSLQSIPYRTFNQDFWIGKAFPLHNGTTFNTSFRFAHAGFSRRPIVSQDSNYFYRDRILLLTAFSLINLNYYLSSLVYGFGITEDIPYGYKISLIGGIEKNQFVSSPYLGGSFSYGKHYKFPGYILFNAEYGSFFTDGGTQDRVLKFKLLNIGNLHRFNRYSLRLFTDIDFQSGKHMSDPNSRAIINGRWASVVSGLNKEALKGQEKLTVNIESIVFTPWYILGFKFAMLAYADFGWVSQQQLTKKTISFYNSIGAGLRIKNESWVFETITLGVAYFIHAPPGSERMGYIFDGSDPRFFRNLNPGRPETIKMDQEPVLFLE